MPPEIRPMTGFPSSFQSSWQVARALYHTALWSGGRRATVWIPQFASLRNHVREISRSAAGSRVEKLSRTLSLWPDLAEVSASLPADSAAELMSACLDEAAALLELGYPSGEGLDFVTRMPSPGSNGRRTPAEMRSAVHHLGGDFQLLRTMMRVPDPFAPCLRVTFSVWPRYLPPGEHESLLLSHPGGRLPTTVHYRRDLRGYALLCMFDLSARLKAAEGIQMSHAGFGAFADELS